MLRLDVELFLMVTEKVKHFFHVFEGLVAISVIVTRLPTVTVTSAAAWLGCAAFLGSIATVVVAAIIALP